jgi:hypothetical protein
MMLPGKPEAIALDAECRWFSVSNGTRVDLSRRRVLRRLMRILVDRRLHAPGETVPIDDLIHGVWPGQTLDRWSALNRLRVSIIALRRFGLRPVLLTGTTTRGYHLDPSFPLLLESDVASDLGAAAMDVAS